MRTLPALVASLALGTALSAQRACTSTVLGPGCGPVLTVTFTPVGQAGNHDMTLAATGLAPDSWGVMAWGVQNFSLPLGGCLLHTDMIWGHVFHTDATATFGYSRTWPASVDGWYHIQIGTLQVDALGDLTVQGTNAVRAACQ